MSLRRPESYSAEGDEDAEDYSDQPLPEKAERWLDVLIAENTAKIVLENPQLASLLAGLDENRSVIEERFKYTIRAFRDLHHLAYPERSIFSLNVSDELLLDAIWKDIYWIDELEQKIGAGEFTDEDLLFAEGEESETGLEILLAAIREWRLDHPAALSHPSSQDETIKG